MSFLVPAQSPLQQEALDAEIESCPPLTLADDAAQMLAMAAAQGFYPDPSAVAYAEAWGRLIEAVVNDEGMGNFKDTVERTARMANCNSISFAEFENAVNYLAVVWGLRDALVAWRNGQA